MKDSGSPILPPWFEEARPVGFEPFGNGVFCPVLGDEDEWLCQGDVSPIPGFTGDLFGLEAV